VAKLELFILFENIVTAVIQEEAFNRMIQLGLVVQLIC